MLCSRCQHQNPSEARFCTECGQALPRCRNCGTPVSTAYKFCPACGVPLVMAASAGWETELAAVRPVVEGGAAVETFVISPPALAPPAGPVAVVAPVPRAEAPPVEEERRQVVVL